MSKDKEVTKDLINTLEDGKAGFALAAERLADSDRADLRNKFQEFSNQRGAMAEELRSLAAAYGDGLDESGSIAGTLHRGWISLKDAVTGDSADAIINSAEQGEDHAVAEFKRALDEQDISADLRSVIQRQYGEVCAAHDWVRDQRNTSV